MENPEVIQPGENSATEQNEDSLGFLISGTYGWAILFVCIGLITVWKKLAQPYFLQWQQTRTENREVNHKDEESALVRQRAVEASRMRLQAQMDAAVERHKEKVQEREEAKRQARQQVYENMKKGQTGSAGPNEKKPEEEKLRGNYFPLMGTEPSTCFRPSRRGGGSAGG